MELQVLSCADVPWTFDPQLELKQTAEAKASWRRVMKDYPNSNAAGLARQRLAQTQ